MIRIFWLFCLLFSAAGLFAQENPGSQTVDLQIKDRSIAPVLTQLKPNPFLSYEPNLPSGTFIGVEHKQENFDMVSVMYEENAKREMAKAKRLADISLPQAQLKKEEKAIQFSGPNQQRDQLYNGIDSFNNNTNPFYQYHDRLYNRMGNYYSGPYTSYGNNRYYY